MRDLVFISYAHEDRAWLEKFNEYLRPAEQKGLLRLWSDQKIGPGASWSEEIREALSRSRVALLLVTQAFINSDFIRNDELRSLLAAHQKGDLQLYWVPISASLPELVGLNHLQAAPGCDPEHPLDGLDQADREQRIVQICRAILDQMGSLPTLTSDDRRDLQRRVSERLGGRYEILGEIGTGTSCIAYKARSRNIDRTVVVKALVSSALQRDLVDEYPTRAEMASRLKHPAYIQVYDTFLDAEPYCLVTEYVEGPSLDRFLNQSRKRLSPRRVRKILLELAGALAEAHERDYLHEGLMPSNLHLDGAQRPRVSAFRFLDLGATDRMWGTFLINHETCTYLSPEQFEGRPRTKATDQYALGVVGYELLSGQRLPHVTCAADFLGRPALYQRLERDGEWTRRAPALGGIIARMLRVNPDERWSSMQEIANVLEDVEVEDSPDEAARSRVLASYTRYQTSDRTDELCARIYRRLFAAAPELERAFVGMDMVRHYELLNRALKLLVDYDPVDAALPGPRQALIALAQRHQKYALTPRHFDLFKEALLSALRDGGESTEVLLAWDRLVTPALQQMSLALAPVPQVALTKIDAIAAIDQPLPITSMGKGAHQGTARPSLIR
jgi:hemoglobin-like flavoprotein